MLTGIAPTLGKDERIKSRTLVEKLFNGTESHSFSAFPIRVVYMPIDKDGDSPVKILVSVSKRHFKRAVKRNRIKRQIREAYRRNKNILLEALSQKGGNQTIAIAFLWLSDDLYKSNDVESKVKLLLQRISEKL